MDAEKPYCPSTTTRFPVSPACVLIFGAKVLFLVWLAVLWLGPSAHAGQKVTLGWNPNSEANLGGYRLYYGTASRNYTSSNRVEWWSTTSTVSNLTPGLTYYFAVTAVIADGTESGYSTEISYSVPAAAPSLDFTQVELTPPAPPSSSGLVDTEEVVESDFNSTPPKPMGPRLEITPFGQPIVAYAVAFEAPADKACELQVSSDLQVWQKLFYRGTQPLAEKLQFFDFPGDAKTRRFYRVAIW
jgi:hypothetical protein